MAKRLPVSLNYGTHLPALMRAMALRDGKVLELGMGLFSTPYLHYACALAGRLLVSYENNLDWANFFRNNGYVGKWHQIKVVDDWDAADIESEWSWSVALIDHSPSERRVTEIRRLANFADYIVVHDTNGRYDREYHYSEIYPLFRCRADWTADHTHTVVLSNFHDLGDFWK